jgi:hypothetical protein
LVCRVKALRNISGVSLNLLSLSAGTTTGFAPAKWTMSI